MSQTTSPLPEKSLQLDIVKDNMFKELKRASSVETLLQFKDQDLTMLKQEAACGRYYHGHGNIISQIEKFVGGRGKFSNFWMYACYVDLIPYCDIYVISPLISKLA